MREAVRPDPRPELGLIISAGGHRETAVERAGHLVRHRRRSSSSNASNTAEPEQFKNSSNAPWARPAIGSTVRRNSPRACDLATRPRDAAARDASRSPRHAAWIRAKGLVPTNSPPATFEAFACLRHAADGACAVPGVGHADCSRRRRVQPTQRLTHQIAPRLGEDRRRHASRRRRAPADRRSTVAWTSAKLAPRRLSSPDAPTRPTTEPAHAQLRNVGADRRPARALGVLTRHLTLICS